MSLQNRMRLALKQSGLSQAELARAVKTSRTTVNDWLSGKTQDISGERLFLVAQKLDLNPEWLATGKGNIRVPQYADQVRNVHAGYGDALSQQEQDLLFAFRKLSSQNQHRFSIGLSALFAQF